MTRRASSFCGAVAGFCFAASLCAGEPGWEQKLRDPAVRLRASVPGALPEMAEEIFAGDDAQQSDAWTHLRELARGDKEHALECRLLAWLARKLHRSPDEIQKADDLVLRAVPDLSEGWLNRAEFYAADKDPQKAVWAVDTYLQALKRADLAEPRWRDLLGDTENVWHDRLAKAGKLPQWSDAVADALRNTPKDEARANAATLVLAVLNEKDAVAKPAVVDNLLDAVSSAQPQVLLGAAGGFLESARAFDAAGRKDVARRIARMLALAPVPQDLASEDNGPSGTFEKRWDEAHPVSPPPDDGTTLTKVKQEIAQAQNRAQFEQAKSLRAGWHSLQFFWEDTLPRYLPSSQARWILSTALGDDPDGFATEALADAKECPWDESVISYALVSAALTARLTEEQLTLAGELDAAAKGRIAQRICAIAPKGSYPLDALSPWLAGGAQELIRRSQGREPEQAVFAALLASMDTLERGGQTERLHELLMASLESPPRALDVPHWERLSELFSRHGSPEDSEAFLKTWKNSLGRAPLERDHLPAMADAAVRGGPERGRGFAEEALAIWQRRYAGESRREAPDPYAASRVAEALLTCDSGESFDTFVQGLEKLASQNTLFMRIAQELHDLRGLLTGARGRLPAADAWVQEPAAPDQPARVQWRFVLPGPPGYLYPLMMTVKKPGGNSTDADVPKVPAWWSAGSAHPLLERLAGKFDLEISAGESPDHLNKVAVVSGAKAHGAVDGPTLPASGCIRVTLRSRNGGASRENEPRMYSLRPALAATGRQPDAEGIAPRTESISPFPSPASWTPKDEERWGRLITPPVAIEKNTDYLLTEWNARGAAPAARARLILLDEQMRPLGPVPVASAGYLLKGSQLANWMPHLVSTQRFRASDWAGEDDLVRIRTKEDDEVRPPPATPRFMALVTRDDPKLTTPMLQIRVYHETPTSVESGSSSDSISPPMPELNDEYVASVGFRVHSWHITMGPERAIFTGKGALAGFDVGHIPWKPLVRSESDLLEGNEWPMCFNANRALIVEPPWNGGRSTGVRFVPFSAAGEKYEACERREIPLPTYHRGEISHWMDGALFMVSSQRGADPPEPVAAWLDPDGNTVVLPLPRPAPTNNPGLELAWWGPGSKLTLHEDGILFHLEHFNGLRLISVEPGDPKKLPPGADQPHHKKKWWLEQPQILAERDDNGRTLRRFHLKTPCEGRPMAFDSGGPVFLFTTEHDVLRVNPPER